MPSHPHRATIGVVDGFTRANLEALKGHSVIRIGLLDDGVELGVPESEGWRLRISATLDADDRPTLEARWEPGVTDRAVDLASDPAGLGKR